MRMVYLFNTPDVMDDRNPGIEKKIMMQMEAFQKLGYETIFILFDELRVYINYKTQCYDELSYFSSSDKSYKYVFDKIIELCPDLIYIRYRVMDNHYVYELYKSLGGKFLKCICEIPTFPYDNEFNENDTTIISDRYYRQYLKNIFKYTTNYNCVNNIYGIQSVGLVNGVDIDKIPMKTTYSKTKNEVNLVAIASMNFWHGYERIIEGLYKYYKGNNECIVKFYMIGEGRESAKYHQLILNYKLQDYIFELGTINNKEELEKLFEIMDIAIGSVGMHRLNLDVVSPIKAAEYCARGIPFIIDYKDASFNNDFEYILHVDESDDPIDINKIINFYNELDLEKAGYKMRKYAEENLTWTSQMKKMLNEFSLL